VKERRGRGEESGLRREGLMGRMGNGEKGSLSRLDPTLGDS
jgi:hypothetical protein